MHNLFYCFVFLLLPSTWPGCPVADMSQHSPLCCCRLFGYFGAQKVVSELFALSNIYYNEVTKRFELAQQTLIYWMFVLNLFAWISVVYSAGPDCQIDGYLHLLYAAPCVLYMCKRPWLLEELNAMVGVQRQLADWLCFRVVRVYCWSLLMTVQLGWTIYWQLQLYDYRRLLCVAFCVLCCYLQLLLHFNCFIWLYSSYLAINRMLAASLSKRQRVKLLHRVLAMQPALHKIQRHMTHYFSVYLLSLWVLMLHKLHLAARQQLELQQGVVIVHLQRQQLTYAANLLSLIIILMLAGRDFRNERTKFESSLWRALQQQQPQLSLPQQRRQCLDVVDLMVSAGVIAAINKTFNSFPSLTALHWQSTRSAA